MGNIASIVTYADIKPARVNELMHEINRVRFGGALTIEEDDLQGGGGAWGVSWPEGGLEHGWGFYLETSRSLGGKHPRAGDVGYWVWNEFMHTLAVLLKARCMKDEGVSGSWKPEPGKYPTFDSWIEGSMSHYPTGLAGAAQRAMRRKLAKMGTAQAALDFVIQPWPTELQKLGAVATEAEAVTTEKEVS